MIVSSICLDNGRRHWNALRPRGPFLFRSAGKGSKRGRFARHFGSGKIEPRPNPFGGTHKNSLPHGAQTICAPVFSGRAGKATPALPLKIPSRATQKVDRYAASAFRQRPAALFSFVYQCERYRGLRKRSETMLFCALFSLQLDRQADIFLFFCFSLFFFFMRL
ncbi:MAG: hypothetical protein MR815_05965, partial [Oscillospiraceae bacterium]|nr:hypothetical protein [Oscillospiraceae bacterium]